MSVEEDVFWPKVTILVPTFNNAQSISSTIDSILDQDYPNYEIIALDAHSSDRSVEVLQSYGSRLRLHAFKEYNLFKMLNKGIREAQGTYINVLFPGDFYIHRHTLKDIMHLALYQGSPHLIYCGTLLRDGKTEVKFLFRQLSLDLLKGGQQPTSLQSCWMRRDVFELIGTFREDLLLRGLFEFLCRFCLYSKTKLHYTSLHRALTDYDLRGVTSRIIIRQFIETFQIIYRYFGAWTTLKWLGKQKDLRRFINLGVRRLRWAFLGH